MWMGKWLCLGEGLTGSACVGLVTVWMDKGLTSLGVDEKRVG